MLIDIIAGARPNFMKIAPFIHSLKRAQINGSAVSYRLIHTGQHFDRNMSESFFDQLGIPQPDINLGGGGGTQAEQTAKIMIAYEQVILKNSSDFCIVVGDVTSTLACSIVAKKCGIKVAHIEAGIRSGDLSMPEEINRLVTDSISDYFFTTSEVAGNNLLKSGVDSSRIFFVGNTMIDTLLTHREKFCPPIWWQKEGLEDRKYIVLTLHRPANVDDPVNLKSVLDEITRSSSGLKIVFPVHPRTRQILSKIQFQPASVILTEPQPYLEFNYLVSHSKAVITDSGGITEETTVMGIPCMTLRANTERPETVTMGTNELLGTNPAAIAPAMHKLLSGGWKKGAIPPLWDGRTADRIVDVIIHKISDAW